MNNSIFSQYIERGFFDEKSKVMNTLSDNILINLYQKGNEEALRHLILRYETALFSFIFYKIQDNELANDLFQDTFMKIIITLKEGKYNEEGKFILWAKRIAHNLIIDYYRAKNKYHKVSETTYADEEFSIFDILKDTENNIEDELITQQIYQDLHRIITYLPKNQQEILKLRFFDGLSFKEIAEHTETSINTTLGRVRYALINLRKIVEENRIILTRI